MDLLEVFQKYFNEVPENSSKINSGLCKKCNGRCCANLGCHISPDDLKEITIESIISLIDELKCISIDWWEGDPITGEQTGERVYYLRMKNEGSKVIDAAFGGNACGLLGENGCPLPFSYRPKGARELIPSELECIDGYSKRQCSVDWLKHQGVMSEVYAHYKSLGEVTQNMYSLLNSLFGVLG